MVRKISRTRSRWKGQRTPFSEDLPADEGSPFFFVAQSHVVDSIPALCCDIFKMSVPPSTGPESGVLPSYRPVPEELYYLVVAITHPQHDVNAITKRLRVCRTSTEAKKAAHSSLLNAGFERELFTEYDVNEKHEGSEREMDSSGRVVHAVALDGTTFDVNIKTASNRGMFLPEDEDGMIERDLYHVLQTTVDYSRDAPGGKRHTDVEGSFDSYEAKGFAGTVLLSEEDGITKDSFPEYSEAGPGETDCGYAEDVVVHAVAGLLMR